MSQEVTLATGQAVQVMCFNYHNPSSVNGPFGSIELWVSGGDVVGLMVLTLLFGLPSNTYLALSGSCSGADPHVCQLQGKGYRTQLGHQPVKVELGLTLTMGADWAKGSLVFTQGVAGVAGGLPVMRVACKS